MSDQASRLAFILHLALAGNRVPPERAPAGWVDDAEIPGVMHSFSTLPPFERFATRFKTVSPERALELVATGLVEWLPEDARDLPRDLRLRPVELALVRRLAEYVANRRGNGPRETLETLLREKLADHYGEDFPVQPKPETARRWRRSTCDRLATYLLTLVQPAAPGHPTASTPDLVSRTWILDQVAAWVRAPADTTPPGLVLMGQPGTGKSKLVRLITRQVRTESAEWGGAVIASSIMRDWGSNDVIDPLDWKQVLSELVDRLHDFEATASRHSPTTAPGADVTQSTWERSSRPEPMTAPGTQTPRDAVVGQVLPLVRRLPPGPPILVVVDGLDEAYREQSEAIFDLCEALLTVFRATRLRLLCTTQPELPLDVPNVLLSTLNVDDDVPASENARDLRVFTTAAASSLPPDVVEEVVDSVVARADGNWAYVRYVVDDLVTQHHEGKDVRSITLPRGLAGFYEEALARVRARAGRNWDEVRGVIGIAVAGARWSMPRNVLAGVTGMSSARLDDIAQVVAPVMRIDGDGARLFHGDFARWIERGGCRGIDAGEMHGLVARYVRKRVQDHGWDGIEEYSAARALNHAVAALTFATDDGHSAEIETFVVEMLASSEWAHRQRERLFHLMRALSQVVRATVRLATAPITLRHFAAQFHDVLEFAVGEELARALGEEKLEEFNRFFDASDDRGGFTWLKENQPNYAQVVERCVHELLHEIRSGIVRPSFHPDGGVDAERAARDAEREAEAGRRSWPEVAELWLAAARATTGPTAIARYRIWNAERALRRQWNDTHDLTALDALISTVAANDSDTDATGTGTALVVRAQDLTERAVLTEPAADGRPYASQAAELITQALARTPDDHPRRVSREAHLAALHAVVRLLAGELADPAGAVSADEEVVAHAYATLGDYALERTEHLRDERAARWAVAAFRSGRDHAAEGSDLEAVMLLRLSDALDALYELTKDADRSVVRDEAMVVAERAAAHPAVSPHDRSVAAFRRDTLLLDRARETGAVTDFDAVIATFGDKLASGHAPHVELQILKNIVAARIERHNADPAGAAGLPDAVANLDAAVTLQRRIVAHPANDARGGGLIILAKIMAARATLVPDHADTDLSAAIEAAKRAVDLLGDAGVTKVHAMTLHADLLTRQHHRRVAMTEAGDDVDAPVDDIVALRKAIAAHPAASPDVRARALLAVADLLIARSKRSVPTARSDLERAVTAAREALDPELDAELRLDGCVGLANALNNLRELRKRMGGGTLPLDLAELDELIELNREIRTHPEVGRYDITVVDLLLGQRLFERAMLPDVLRTEDLDEAIAVLQGAHETTSTTQSKVAEEISVALANALTTRWVTLRRHTDDLRRAVEIATPYRDRVLSQLHVVLAERLERLVSQRGR